MSEEVFVGIDVSMDRLDVCFLPGQRESSFSRDAMGIRALARELTRHKATLVVLEATGGLERVVLRRLVMEGLPVVVANPRRVRQYAQAAGILAKTDRLDAMVLAGFARDIRPARRPWRSAQSESLRELVTRRNQLIKMITAEKNRLTRITEKIVAANLRTVVRFLERKVEAVEAAIEKIIESDPELRRTEELLSSVPGVGRKTSRMLMAALPEIGSLSSGQAASLAGLAPFARDSGTLRGKRAITAGRPGVRRALYMAALVASRHNHDIRTFYLRLRERGKPAKVALTACMRKLLVTLNAVVARGSKWTPEAA